MTSAELLQLLGVLLGAAASLAAAIEARLVKKLEKAGAFSADSAMTLSNQRFFSRWQLSRLEKARAIIPTAEGRFFLDRDRYRVLRRKRRKKFLTVLSLVVVVVLAVVLLSRS